MPHDFVRAELVKLGKPREKFWLPRITQPPQPTAPPDQLKMPRIRTPRRRPRRRRGPRTRRSRRSSRARSTVPRSWKPWPPTRSRRGLAHRLEAGGVQPGGGRSVPGAGPRPLRQNYNLPAGLAPDQIPRASGDRPPHQRPTERSATSSWRKIFEQQLRRRRLRQRRQADAQGSCLHLRPCMVLRVQCDQVTRPRHRVAAGDRWSSPWPSADLFARSRPAADEDLPGRPALRRRRRDAEAGAPRAPRAIPARPARRCPRTWTSRASSRCWIRRRSPRSCRAEGLGFSSALWSQVGAQAVIKMKRRGRRARGATLHRGTRRQARALQELPGGRAARRRPPVRQRRGQGVHRATRGLRLAHRVGAHRARRARDSRSSTWTAVARRC